MPDLVQKKAAEVLAAQTIKLFIANTKKGRCTYNGLNLSIKQIYFFWMIKKMLEFRNRLRKWLFPDWRLQPGESSSYTNENLGPLAQYCGFNIASGFSGEQQHVHPSFTPHSHDASKVKLYVTCKAGERY
jgi:hypothetical protein